MKLRITFPVRVWLIGIWLDAVGLKRVGTCLIRLQRRYLPIR